VVSDTYTVTAEVLSMDHNTGSDWGVIIPVQRLSVLFFFQMLLIPNPENEHLSKSNNNKLNLTGICSMMNRTRDQPIRREGEIGPLPR